MKNSLPTTSTPPLFLKKPLIISSSSSSDFTPPVPAPSSSFSLSPAKRISQETSRPSQNPHEAKNSGVKRRGDSITSPVPHHRHFFSTSSLLSPPCSSHLAPSSSSSSFSSSLTREKALSCCWMNEEEIEKHQLAEEEEGHLLRDSHFLISRSKEPLPPQLAFTSTMGAEQSNRSGGGGLGDGREGLEEDILQRQGRRSIEGREDHLSSSTLGFPSQGQSARHPHHLFHHSSENMPPYLGDKRGEGEEEEERSPEKGFAFQNRLSSTEASHLPSPGHQGRRDERDRERTTGLSREEEGRRRGSHVTHTGSSSNSGMPTTPTSTFASGLVPSVLSRSATWASSLLGRR